MKLTNPSTVPVYTISGSSTARPLPEWLARKRKRSLKQDPEYANRIESLQDFEFEEASQCVRISEDQDWVMSTGTYKPQIHTHYLPHLSLSYARHTNTINQTFLLLSTDYSKSLHLQTDRFLEFHNPGGSHYSTRIPRYGRDLKYNKRAAEASVPSVGVNADGNGEVFRSNSEVGRFMKGYEIDVGGGDDYETVGGGALQGGINAGSVNVAAVAEESHNLLAFGTSIGTVEFWDHRSRSRVGILPPPVGTSDYGTSERAEITALEFHRSGLNFASGSSTGLVHLYDLRSPVPILQKDQGYGYAIQSSKYLTPSTRSASSAGSTEKIMSADKRIIKLWDAASGDPWTSVEPAVDLNHVEWCPDSGMSLTANEGRQQHSFFIPQLGPAPKWCAFLDNSVEEMAEDADDPNAFTTGQSVGSVYDNYKFLDMKQSRELNSDHLVGTTNSLRPYMHGYFVAQKSYEQARLISNPEVFEQQRQKSIQERINKERESRIRGAKGVKVKVNRKLAEKMAAREEANERRKARRVLKQGGDEPQPDMEVDGEAASDEEEQEAKPARGVSGDDRFAKLFQDEDFEIDEMSREFALHNPSSVPTAGAASERKRGLTAVEQEALDDRRASSDEDSDEDTDEDTDEEEREAVRRQRQRGKERGEEENGPNKNKISSSSYRRAGHKSSEQHRKEREARQGPRMVVSNSKPGRRPQEQRRDRSFGDLAQGMGDRRQNGRGGRREEVGEKEVTFAPQKVEKKQYRRRDDGDEGDNGRKFSRGKERRSASGNVFRKM